MLKVLVKKAEGNTTSTEEVKDGNKITLKAGNNLEIKQDGTNFTYSLNPELTGTYFYRW